MRRLVGLALALNLAHALAGCSSGQDGPVTQAGASLSGAGEAVAGEIRLVGQSDHSGATVTIDGAGPSATTDASGRFVITGVSEGFHSLHVAKGEFSEVVPALLVTAGAEPLLTFDVMVPLPSVEVPRAHRLAMSNSPQWPQVGVLPGGRTWYVAFASPDDALGRLDVVDAGGERTVVSYQAGYPAFSKDGSQVVFASSDCGAQTGTCPWSFWIAPTSGGAAARLGAAEASYPLAGFSPTGAHVQVPKGGPSQGFKVFATIDRSLVEDQPGSDPVFSPDGTRLLWTADGWTLLTKPIGTGTAVTLGRDARNASFTRDGTSIIAIVNASSSRDLVLASAADGTSRTLASGVGTYLLLPDGARVLYERTDGTRWSAPLAGGAASPVGANAPGRQGVTGSEWMVLSPDGRRCTFVTDTDPYTGKGPLWVADVAGGTPATLLASDAWWAKAFSGDGSRVLFETLDSLRSVAVTGGPVTVLGGSAQTLAVQPGGAAVAYTELVNDPLPRLRTRLVRADGSGARTVAPDSLDLGGLKFSPDGATLAFLERSPENAVAASGYQATGTLSTVRVDGGAVVPRLPRATFAVWEGNGSLVASRAFTAAPFSFQNGIYRVPVTAGDGGACVPACDGKACGEDGCGGSCGGCTGGLVCDGAACVTPPPVCVPSCSGLSCGDDGCGGSCGTCAAGIRCIANACTPPDTSGGPAWHIVEGGPVGGFMWGSGSNDVWIGGIVAGGPDHRCQMSHWDGAAWTSAILGDFFHCQAIWGSAADDVWVVGGEPTAPDGGSALGAIYRWDGSQWSRFHLGGATLLAVGGTGPGDVWFTRGTHDVSVWNGTALVSRPIPTEFSQTITSLWGSGPDDVWAVGRYAYHWDGTRWRDHGASFFDTTFLWDVWGSGPADVWAVGNSGSGTTTGNIWHWDGTAWDPKLVPGESFDAIWGSGSQARVVARSSMLAWDGVAWSEWPHGLDVAQARHLWGTSANDLWMIAATPTGAMFLARYY